MQPKPDFLGPQAAASFQDASVVQAYQYRPSYPDAAFDLLTELMVDSPRHVLDVGCGTGAVARPLAARVEHVDAIDISQEMVEQGKRLPRGDNPCLNWIVGRVEDAPLSPPYALITAGASLHWLDWYVVMLRFARMLTPHGYLVELGVDLLETPWEDDLRTIRRRYGTIPNWQYYDHIKALEERGLFQRIGSQQLEPVPFTQSLTDYIESFHGRASFSRQRMTPENAVAFDEAVYSLVSPYCKDGMLELQAVTELVWGKPLDFRG